MKTCNKCGIDKEESEYHKRGNALKGTCKTCRKEENKKHYYKDHDKTKQNKRIAWHKSQLKKILKEREL